MGKGRKVLSADHARALIKQAIGMIFGDITVETEATAEIAAIEAQHAKGRVKATKPTKPSSTPGP
ncbi:hypothetical protein SAMN05216360_102400 [Methylobacterium phyllostachyos]|uniref:Uncharacterized protein n=1 Tax=Methylobacterium phyllostachyos TaxID=582672 RepID=A0A1G9U530_9HYPH|nr:hypothetical protein [Methylobacterium phyllostachyos]SDM54695.1 hypothetical protein SAMN05216360_102400 [Methylobacterium phyllostachyos]